MMVDLDTLEQVDTNGWTLISENENSKSYQKEDIEKRITSFENYSLEEHYKQGRLHGITIGRMYTPFLHYPVKECSIYSIEHYENDALRGASFHFYDDGSKTESDYKNGLTDGVQREWFGNGQLKEQAQYHNGTLHGERNWYHENGKPSIKEQYVNNQLEGERFLYDENGDLESRQVYKNDERLK